MSQYVIMTVNFAGLMALTAIAFGLVLKSVTGDHAQQALFGVVLGLGAAFVSLQPIMFVHGLQIDPRNLFVGCAGAFAGPVGGAISFAIAAATRYFEGDPSAYVCVLSLFVATAAGLVWRSLCWKRGKVGAVQLLLLGLGISLSYVCTFLLPREDWRVVFSSAIPFLTITNVIGTLVLGGFLERERRRRLREDHLKDQASVDPLTGLKNRRAFETAYEATASLQSASLGMAFILIDLDHFKKVNDTYGHAAGDRVLVGVAGKLVSRLRDFDLTARFGGEEFAVCLPDTGREDAMMIAERLRRAVIEVGKSAAVPELTASIGICWTPSPVAMRKAFDSADRALYRAKLNGRNQVIVDSIDVGGAAMLPPAVPPGEPDRSVPA
ncbi:diguanylate cyclase [Martelella radicis]|uniref:diguanylate cyclase n=1 Tax=Martelella radicis TaxID=1397476 RepID=A0A7W6KIS3_9HYPH|nr:diguanylate cyclase [Martelella radicis]MBB4121892.1 diguanylate cyclase [Martelella radicis]